MLLNIIRHVSVSYGRHCHDRPPKRVWNWFEEGVFASRLREVHRRRKQHHTFKNKHIRTENTVRQAKVWLRAGGARARRGLPHVTVADCGHRYDSPPKAVRYRAIVRAFTVFLCEVHRTGEDYDTCEHNIILCTHALFAMNARAAPRARRRRQCRQQAPSSASTLASPTTHTQYYITQVTITQFYWT